MKRYFFAVFFLAGTICADEEGQGAPFELYEAQDFSFLFSTSKFPKELLELHIKLYEGYVKNARKLLEQLAEMRKEGSEKTYAYGALKRRLNFEMSGLRLHEYYFSELGGQGVPASHSHFIDALIEQFGSYEAWKHDFVQTGMMRGIGWVVLCLDEQTGALLNIWIEEHNLGNLVGLAPLLVMDVWEHAYITIFHLNRRRYIEAFFREIDWPLIEKRFNSVG
ncbi:MAG: Fe-Mn family superoxide dismutase [Chlamydiota bacterium]